MPYWWRRNYYPKRWRRRRFRRWRLRKPVRRRLYRRRHRVRYKKRKLKKLILRTWQPDKIRKCTVKGIYPSFLSTHKRLSHNMTQYLDSPTPPKWPGAGGFSICQFTLNCLYEEFIKARNLWTKSNEEMPLFRYTGCTIKLYRTQNFDYVVHVDDCYPLRATDLMYMSTQPSILMMTKGSKLVTCRAKAPNKKPYKKIFIRPPTQWNSGWYFQKDLANTPLFVIRQAAASFDRYYLASNSPSTTIGFESLNTTTFNLHNWNKPPTTGYKPQENLYFYGSLETPPDNPMKTKLGNMIYLGNTGPLTLGTTFENKTKFAKYYTTQSLWGNIFHPQWLTQTDEVFVSNLSLKQIYDKWNSTAWQKITENSTLDSLPESIFTPREIPNLTYCRYNPFTDKATGNKLWLVSNHTDRGPWETQQDPQLIRENLPLWLLTWGWTDWQKKLAKVHQIDTEYMTVIESPYIVPPQKFYLPIDSNMTDQHPHSPYSDTLFENDEKNFYPKGRFQVETLNEIATSGPGTIKLAPDQSCESHFLYKFHFKFGGCPPNMEKIFSPAAQETFPIPHNEQRTPSLQSPETPIETFMYNFDFRRDLLTTQAAKRIKKDYQTTDYALPFTGAKTDLPTPYQGPPSQETTSSEEEEEDLQQQLNRVQRKQRKLQHKILQLLTIQNTK
nr:MAG: ORF1 [TTV-like mini virus]